MDQISGVCTQSEHFVSLLLHIYLEDRNLSRLLSMLHQNITWIGPVESGQPSVELLKKSVRIIKENYTSAALSDQYFLITGQLELITQPETSCGHKEQMEVSMVCTREHEQFLLLHAHLSSFNSDSGTKMAPLKADYLHRLMNTLCAGVQICAFEEGLPIEYINEGFTELTGYTYEDINTLYEGRHLLLVYKPDAAAILADIKRQLEEGARFSLEYRIVRKDGRVTWVLDRGSVFMKANGHTYLQSILTDITARKQQELALRFSEKRYEIAMQLSETTMYEYNVVTGELMLYDENAKDYNVPNIIPNGVETFVSKGIIDPSCETDFREMYRLIHNGAPFAKCRVKSRNASGAMHDYELSLTNVFDDDGRPLRAIGVRKSITTMLTLQKEQDFNKSLVSGKTFLLEADITADRLEYLNEAWKKDLGEADLTSYSSCIRRLVSRLIVPEHQKEFLEKVSSEHLAYAFETGQTLVSFEYKRIESSGETAWYNADLNMIRSPSSGSLIFRFYSDNINSRKLKEQKALEEQRLYESMISRATLAYEVNLTKNLALKGHEKWSFLYGITASDNYSLMITEFSDHAVHPEDKAVFFNTLRRDNILSLFEKGERKLSCKYRRYTQDGGYRWVCCTLHLYEDPETNDVKGFSYVEDIDEQKRSELSLKFNAEHDAMTGVYNKAVTEQKITEYLATAEGKTGTHAFLMIDIDYFKFVNDTFGHVFGDDVIKEVAAKICSVFREQDIVGRIGGDEFGVFMKNLHSLQNAKEKAAKICEVIRSSYTDASKSCTISASVGIAVCRRHSMDFLELYRQADLMLYKAKKKGKNRFEL